MNSAGFGQQSVQLWSSSKAIESILAGTYPSWYLHAISGYSFSGGTMGLVNPRILAMASNLSEGLDFEDGRWSPEE